MKLPIRTSTAEAPSSVSSLPRSTETQTAPSPSGGSEHSETPSTGTCRAAVVAYMMQLAVSTLAVAVASWNVAATQAGCLSQGRGSRP